MKRIFHTLLAAVLAVGLAGCSTLGDITGLSEAAVKVAETVTDDSTSAKGITTGMSSSDARDVLMNRDYYGAIKAVHGAGKDGGGPQLLLDIEPLDNQPIIIHAKRFKLYAPPSAGAAPQLSIAPPAQKTPTWKAVSQEARGWFRDVLVPWKSIDENGETRRHESDNSTAVRQTELGVINNAVVGSQGIAGQAITTFKPLVVHAPAPAPAAAPADPDPAAE